MKNLFNNPWIVGILGIVAFGYLIATLVPLFLPMTAQAALVNEEFVPPLVDPEPIQPAGSREMSIGVQKDQIEWRDGFFRDPFVGRMRAKEVVRLPRVQALFWDDQTSRAVINGLLVSVGDNVSGYAVVAIDRESVLLSHERQTFRIEP